MLDHNSHSFFERVILYDSHEIFGCEQFGWVIEVGTCSIKVMRIWLFTHITYFLFLLILSKYKCSPSFWLPLNIISRINMIGCTFSYFLVKIKLYFSSGHGRSRCPLINSLSKYLLDKFLILSILIIGLFILLFPRCLGSRLFSIVRHESLWFIQSQSSVGRRSPL